MISKNGSKIYYVIDKEHNKFIVESIIWKVTNKENIEWDNLEIGKTYKIVGYGICMPILEICPKIIEIHNIS